jgi:WD40 repeat protein
MGLKIVGILLSFSLLYGELLTPANQIEAQGNVIDMVVQEGLLIAGTDGGTLEIYDELTHELKQTIVFDPIEDFMGNPMASKIFSVDKIKGSQRYLALLQSPTSYRRLAIVQDGVVDYVIEESDKLMIKKAKFVSSDKVLLGLLSNEILLFDLNSKKSIYRYQLTQSHFSDFDLSDDKTLAVSTDESGKVYLVDVATGNVLQTYSGGNVDNIYKLDMQGNRIITAGQDRRGIVYDRSLGKFDRYDGEFLIYACALSPSSDLGAFAFTEQNDIVIYELKSGRKIHTLRGQKSTLNSIVFVDEKKLYSASDDKFIMQWRLP